MMEEVYRSLASWYDRSVLIVRACKEIAKLRATLRSGLKHDMDVGNLTDRIAAIQIVIEELIVLFGIDRAKLSQAREERIRALSDQLMKDIYEKMLADSVMK